MASAGSPDDLVRLICAQGKIADRFSSLAPLGDGRPGHFSLVFEAHDERTGETVILKFLNPGERDEYRKKSFAREAKILQAFVGKDAIVQVRSELMIHTLTLVEKTTGISLDIPLSLFALERASNTLSHYLLGKSKPAPLRRRLEVLRDVAKGVNRLHSAGYCHRDLKPDNILMFSGGEAKLGDLGTCRPLNGGAPLAPDYFTPVGDIGFCAPETFFGSGNLATLHTSADWFSVGSILFEAVTGVNLYVAIGLRNEDLIRMMQQFQQLPVDERLRQFTRIVKATAGQYPIPSIREFRHEPWLQLEDDETLTALDDLIRSLCHFDFERRLTIFTPILRKLDVCLLLTRTTEVRRALRLMRGKQIK